MIKITGPAIVLTLTAIFLFLAATNIQAGWLYLVDAFMWSVIFISGIIPFLQYRKLTVKRLHRLSCYSKAPIQITLEITNNSKFSTYFLSLDDFKPEKLINASRKQKLQKQKGFIVSLKAGETYQHPYETIIEQRGVYQFTSIEITSFGPFGLMGLTWKVNCFSEIIIYPNRPEQFQQKSQNKAVGDEQFLPSYKKAFSNYISHFRDYQPGDNIRYIHWKNSARQNKLVIYEMLEIQSPKASLIVNTQMKQTSKAFEKVIQLAGKIALSHIQEGHALSLLAQSPQENIWPESHWPKRITPNVQNWRDIAHWLAYLESDSADELSDWLEQEGLSNQHLIILSSHIDKNLHHFLTRFVDSHYCKITLFYTGKKEYPMPSSEKLTYTWVSD